MVGKSLNFCKDGLLQRAENLRVGTRCGAVRFCPWPPPAVLYKLNPLGYLVLKRLLRELAECPMESRLILHELAECPIESRLFLDALVGVQYSHA